MDEIRRYTKECEIFNILANIIMEGWPNNKEELNKDIQQYYTLNENLVYLNYIIINNSLIFNIN